jgi:2-dehydro-3-deoxygalactonokinase
MQSQYFLGCDWGTSSFRLRLFNKETKIVEGEISSAKGVLSTYRSWQDTFPNDGNSCEVFFRIELKQQLDLLSTETSIDISNIIIVLSGMASSSIGMKNLPYARVPFLLDGSNAVAERIKGDSILSNDILLVSGIKTTNDVLRGEETQLIGIIDLLKERKQYHDSAIFLFPGTHSKHIFVSDDAIVDFKTYMTGEMFSMLCEHSILKDSVDSSTMDLKLEHNIMAFKYGIQASLDDSILNLLFSVRTNQLFQHLDKVPNAFYLSGLLIGSELKALLNQKDCSIYLCSSSNLHEFYQLAMHELGMMSHAIVFPSELICQATLRGQMMLGEI